MRFALAIFGGSARAGMPCPVGVDGLSASTCAEGQPRHMHPESLLPGRARTSWSEARGALLSAHTPSRLMACASSHGLHSYVCLAASQWCALEQGGWGHCMLHTFAGSGGVMAAKASRCYSAPNVSAYLWCQIYLASGLANQRSCPSFCQSPGGLYRGCGKDAYCRT